jgi:PAS domain S-box-containing protein
MVSLVLVENEFVLAEDVPSRLRAAGFDIIGTPATGRDAIAQARELHPDVVLMDPELKGKMDGIEVAQQIKERFDIPVIFLTAHTDAATVKRAAATTSYGFLVKPFDDLELSAAIEMAIHRHSTEAKMRESDRRIRELTESLSEVIFETDMAGTITFINRAGLKEFGYTKEQVEGGMTLYDVLPLDKHEEIRELIAQAVIDEPSGWMEVPGLRRDGSTFPISVRASLIVREGVPVGIRGIALNVTERKRAEQQLEESEKRIRELTDALPEIIFETDANLIVTFASAAIFTRYGWTTGEVEGKMNILDMVAPFDRERARETISERMYGEDKGWAEYKAEYAVIINKDGSTAPFDVRTIPIIRDGVFEGLRGIAIDVTERKRAEAALIRSERRIREITNALPVVVYETDTTGRMTFMNTTVFDLFGYTKEEIEAGMTVYQLIAPADLKRARAVFRRRMNEEDVGRVEYTGLRKDGSTFNLAARSALIRRDGAVVGQRGVMLDVTEQKRAEERVKEHTDTIEILNHIMTEGNRAASVESFAETVTKLTLELIHFDVGTIHLYDYDTRRANLCYATGIPDIAVEAIRGIPLDEALYARVLVEGKPLFVDGLEALRVPHAAELGLESLAVVPLYHYNKRIGVLNVGNSQRHAFSQAEKELLIAIGNEAGVVIAKLRADEALKESEKRIREIADALPEIIFETDADGIITFANATSFTRYGYTKGEIEGKMKFLDFVVPFDRERVRETIRIRVQGEDKGWAEYALIKKDGSTAPVDVRTTPIVRDGVYKGLRGIAIDITERKRAEAALIGSERRIREITDALPVVVYETDATGRITFANTTALDLFGYTKEELEAGMSLFQLVVPADTERARAVFRRRMSGKKVGRMEYTGLRKDGSTFNMAARSALIRQDGAVVGQRGVMLDVTEQKRAEERVKEHTHTIETLNRIMTEGNRATDVQSFIEAATKLACELMHFDIGGIYLIDADARYATLQYGQGLPETARDAIEKIPYHDAPFSAILIDGGPLFAEDYVTFLPQHAPLGVASLASVPLYSRDTIIGALNVGSAIRHTFSQTEKALLVAIGNEAGTVIAKLQADASVRAALKEKETLLKEIHHRVKNNMQVVSSLMSLQADRATNVEAQAVLTASQSQIRSMALIHEKLYSSDTLSEIEFAGYVGSLINELLQMYHVAPDAVTITTDIEDVRFGVDIAMPCALILNELVSNCLKYAFPDGRVGEVIVGMQYADGTYTLTVADNGVGFPADVDFRATGSLGMQLVTALVDQLDGTIDMNRENGTSFVISFSPAP